MRRDRERLKDILETIENLEAIRSAGQVAFDGALNFRSAAKRHLEIIGEAPTQLSPSVRPLAPEVPWKQILGSRIIYPHVYWHVDHAEVWRTLQDDLQPLKSAILALLARPDIE